MPADTQPLAPRRTVKIQRVAESRLRAVRAHDEARANRLTFNQQACHASLLEKRSCHASACVQCNARSLRGHLGEYGVQFAPPDPPPQTCCSALRKMPLGYAAFTVVSNAVKFRADPGRANSPPLHRCAPS